MYSEPETLEDFLVAHAAAALYAYRSPQLRPLLEGEETVMGATVFLLEKRLSAGVRAGGLSETAAAVHSRKHRAGETRPKAPKSSPYLGVCAHAGRWLAQVRDPVTKSKRYIGYGLTQREAAEKYDAYVSAHYPGRETNASKGLL